MWYKIRKKELEIKTGIKKRQKVTKISKKSKTSGNNLMKTKNPSAKVPQKRTQLTTIQEKILAINAREEGKMNQKPEEKKVLKRKRKEEDQEMTDRDQSGKKRKRTLSKRHETRHGVNFDANSTEVPERPNEAEQDKGIGARTEIRK